MKVRVTVLALLCLLATAASLVLGARTLVEVPSPSEFWSALFSPDPDDALSAVVQSRIPRTVNAILAGAGLAVAGAAMQGLTRNPLAEPGLLGINSGASLFVVAGLTAFGSLTAAMQASVAFAGACTTAVVVYILAGRSTKSPLSLILVGAAVMAGTSSLVSAFILSSNQTLDVFRSWQIGSINRSDTSQAAQLLPLFAIGIFVIILQTRSLNAFAMGDDMATALGINTTRSGALILAGVALLSAATVALVGPLMFVGLIVPHLVRSLLGANYRILVPMCIIAGPTLMLLSDILGRVIFAPSEIPVGIMLAFVGAPYFLYLLRAPSPAAKHKKMPDNNSQPMTKLARKNDARSAL